MRSSARSERLGLEFEIADVESGNSGSEVYDAFVVTAPSGQKFRIGTRWSRPFGETNVSGAAGPKERELK